MLRIEFLEKMKNVLSKPCTKNAKKIYITFSILLFSQQISNGKPLILHFPVIKLLLLVKNAHEE